MDPLNPSSFTHKTAKLSTGRNYHFIDQVPANFDLKRTPALLCVHGFPDFWYGWRYQILPWVRRGFRVVVPDMLGYGGTDKPFDASEYSTRKLCGDLAALLDLLDIKKAVVVGHDWGSFTAGRFALWYPDRLLALIMLSVPFTPPTHQYISIQELAERIPTFGYQVYFDDPRSTREIEANLDKFLTLMYRVPKSGPSFTGLGKLSTILSDKSVDVAGGPSVLNDIELQYYRQELQKGMQGPLNYYRTSKFRYDEEQAAGLPSTLASDLPVLYLWGTQDPTSSSVQLSKARKSVPRWQDVALEGRGHWLMIEAKDDVTNTVIRWLELLAPQPKRQGKL